MKKRKQIWKSFKRVNSFLLPILFGLGFMGLMSYLTTHVSGWFILLSIPFFYWVFILVDLNENAGGL